MIRFSFLLSGSTYYRCMYWNPVGLTWFGRRTVRDTYTRLGWQISRSYSRLESLKCTKVGFHVWAMACDMISLSYRQDGILSYKARKIVMNEHTNLIEVHVVHNGINGLNSLPSAVPSQQRYWTVLRKSPAYTSTMWFLPSEKATREPAISLLTACRSIQFPSFGGQMRHTTNVKSLAKNDILPAVLRGIPSLHEYVQMTLELYNQVQDFLNGSETSSTLPIRSSIRQSHSPILIRPILQLPWFSNYHFQNLFRSVEQRTTVHMW